MHRDHEHDVLCLMGEKVFGWNVEDAHRAYAEQTGREPMTKQEKQVAYLNYVIETAGADAR